LAYLARTLTEAARLVVHGSEHDAWAAPDIQRSGALYDRTERLMVALPAYLGARLPLTDRRDPSRPDRRRLARGGRRAWDRRPVDRSVDTGGYDDTFEIPTQPE